MTPYYPIIIEISIENPMNGASGKISVGLHPERIADIGLEKAIDEILVKVKKQMLSNKKTFDSKQNA
jgi:hypothetical protein